MKGRRNRGKKGNCNQNHEVYFHSSRNLCHLSLRVTLGVLNQFEKQDKIEVMAEFLDDKHIQPLIREKITATHMHTSVISALKSSLQVLKVSKCNDELFMKRVL